MKLKRGIGFSFLLLLGLAGLTKLQFSSTPVAQALTSDSQAEPASDSTGQNQSASAGNRKFDDFEKSKKVALQIHAENPTTIYCPCKFTGKTVDLESCGYKPHKDKKRAHRLEWEHVVPAHAFGQAFKEWREGDAKCKRNGKTFKGRKCAKLNPEYARMEADLYNLWPSVGELNGLRSNYSMAMIADADAMTFGACKAKIHDKKFEPMDADKGVVARTYLYMEENYRGRGIISSKNQKLFQAWDKLYPVTAWECKRAELIGKIQGNTNRILAERCQNRKVTAGVANEAASSAAH